MTTPADLTTWLDDLEAAEGFVGLPGQVLHQLRQRVGEITPLQKQQLLNLSEDQLQQLQNAALTFETSQALDQWLGSLSPA